MCLTLSVCIKAAELQLTFVSATGPLIEVSPISPRVDHIIEDAATTHHLAPWKFTLLIFHSCISGFRSKIRIGRMIIYIDSNEKKEFLSHLSNTDSKGLSYISNSRR